MKWLSEVVDYSSVFQCYERVQNDYLEDLDHCLLRVVCWGGGWVFTCSHFLLAGSLDVCLWIAHTKRGSHQPTNLYRYVPSNFEMPYDMHF